MSFAPFSSVGTLFSSTSILVDPSRATSREDCWIKNSYLVEWIERCSREAGNGHAEAMNGEGWHTARRGDGDGAPVDDDDITTMEPEREIACVKAFWFFNRVCFRPVSNIPPSGREPGGGKEVRKGPFLLAAREWVGWRSRGCCFPSPPILRTANVEGKKDRRIESMESGPNHGNIDRA